MWIERDGNKIDWAGTPDEFMASSLPGKRWVESTPPEPPAPHIPTDEEIIGQLQQAVQDHLDAGARVRLYDGILSACSYAASTDTIFQTEGQAYVTFRDGCWRKCYQVMGDVKSGSRSILTAEELINEMPILVLP